MPLILIEGPAGGGKSELLRELLAAGEIDVAADVTALWAATGGAERDPVTGKFPIRLETDPVLTREPLPANCRGGLCTARRLQRCRDHVTT